MGQPTGLKRRWSILRVKGQLSQPVLSGLSVVSFLLILDTSGRSTSFLACSTKGIVIFSRAGYRPGHRQGGR